MRAAATYSVSDDIRATVARLVAYIGALAAFAVGVLSLFGDPPAYRHGADGGSDAAGLGHGRTPLPRLRAVDAGACRHRLQLLDPAPLRRRRLQGPHDLGRRRSCGPYATADRFLDAVSEIAARIIDLQHRRRRQIRHRAAGRLRD